MRVRTMLAIAALVLLTATACGKHKKSAFPAGPPPAYAGSYALSCRAITGLDGGFIAAECADTKGHFNVSYLQASVCKGDIGNNNGLLVCNGATATTTPPAVIPGAPPPVASDAAASSRAPPPKH